MKNKILNYIFNNPELSTFDGHYIIIDFSINPIRAIILENLIKKHFNVIRSRCVGGFISDYLIKF